MGSTALFLPALLAGLPAVLAGAPLPEGSVRLERKALTRASLGGSIAAQADPKGGSVADRFARSLQAQDPQRKPVTLRVDFARSAGLFRPLHGINKGPLAAGGLVDITEAQRALGVPLTRLHDCHWPNPDVVDFHAVFPNADADPARPESYDFALTDAYLAAVRATGARVVYRLGESIEHTHPKRYVHPPKDPAKWAAAAVGIIRHYNEGWANGFRWGIRYWEVWNEPENRPACWTGSDEEYLALYRAAARAIKAHDPSLEVGGPSVGYTGRIAGGELQPGEFITAFVERCRREKLPLNFLSWHCYTDDPAELVVRARGMRALLDTNGFTQAESHLNEWNYLPGNDWAGCSREATPPARQAFYQQMAGAPGAAFIAAALLLLQDAPVDAGCLFHGETGGFGFFSEHGVPAKSYHAVRAFRMLLDTPQRARVEGVPPGRLAAGAGVAADASSAALLVSHVAADVAEVRVDLASLPWQGASACEVRRVDDEHDLNAAESLRLEAGASLTLRLQSPGVALVKLRPAN